MADTPGSKEELVRFPEVSMLYPPNQDLTVSYTLSPGVSPGSLDWIGIFPHTKEDDDHNAPADNSKDPPNPVAFQWAPMSPKHGSKKQQKNWQATFPAKLIQSLESTTTRYYIAYVKKPRRILGQSPLFMVREETLCDIEPECVSPTISWDEDWDITGMDKSSSTDLSDIVVLSLSPSKEHAHKLDSPLAASNFEGFVVAERQEPELLPEADGKPEQPRIQVVCETSPPKGKRCKKDQLPLPFIKPRVKEVVSLDVEEKKLTAQTANTAQAEIAKPFLIERLKFVNLTPAEDDDEDDEGISVSDKPSSDAADGLKKKKKKEKKKKAKLSHQLIEEVSDKNESEQVTAFELKNIGKSELKKERKKNRKQAKRDKQKNDLASNCKGVVDLCSETKSILKPNVTSDEAKTDGGAVICTECNAENNTPKETVMVSFCDTQTAPVTNPETLSKKQRRRLKKRQNNKQSFATSLTLAESKVKDTFLEPELKDSSASEVPKKDKESKLKLSFDELATLEETENHGLEEYSSAGSFEKYALYRQRERQRRQKLRQKAKIRKQVKKSPWQTLDLSCVFETNDVVTPEIVEPALPAVCDVTSHDLQPVLGSTCSPLVTEIHDTPTERSKCTVGSPECLLDVTDNLPQGASEDYGHFWKLYRDMRKMYNSENPIMHRKSSMANYIKAKYKIDMAKKLCLKCKPKSAFANVVDQMDQQGESNGQVEDFSQVQRPPCLGATDDESAEVNKLEDIPWPDLMASGVKPNGQGFKFNPPEEPCGVLNVMSYACAVKKPQYPTRPKSEAQINGILEAPMSLETADVLREESQETEASATVFSSVLPDQVTLSGNEEVEKPPGAVESSEDNTTVDTPLIKIQDEIKTRLKKKATKRFLKRKPAQEPYPLSKRCKNRVNLFITEDLDGVAKNTSSGEKSEAESNEFKPNSQWFGTDFCPLSTDAEETNTCQFLPSTLFGLSWPTLEPTKKSEEPKECDPPSFFNNFIEDFKSLCSEIAPSGDDVLKSTEGGSTPAPVEKEVKEKDAKDHDAVLEMALASTLTENMELRERVKALEETALTATSSLKDSCEAGCQEVVSPCTRPKKGLKKSDVIRLRCEVAQLTTEVKAYEKVIQCLESQLQLVTSAFEEEQVKARKADAKRQALRRKLKEVVRNFKRKRQEIDVTEMSGLLHQTAADVGSASCSREHDWVSEEPVEEELSLKMNGSARLGDTTSHIGTVSTTEPRRNALVPVSCVQSATTDSVKAMIQPTVKLPTGFTQHICPVCSQARSQESATHTDHQMSNQQNQKQASGQIYQPPNGTVFRFTGSTQQPLLQHQPNQTNIGRALLPTPEHAVPITFQCSESRANWRSRSRTPQRNGRTPSKSPLGKKGWSYGKPKSGTSVAFVPARPYSDASKVSGFLPQQYDKKEPQSESSQNVFLFPFPNGAQAKSSEVQDNNLQVPSTPTLVGHLKDVAQQNVEPQKPNLPFPELITSLQESNNCASLPPDEIARFYQNMQRQNNDQASFVYPALRQAWSLLSEMYQSQNREGDLAEKIGNSSQNHNPSHPKGPVQHFHQRKDQSVPFSFTPFPSLAFQSEARDRADQESSFPFSSLSHPHCSYPHHKTGHHSVLKPAGHFVGSCGTHDSHNIDQRLIEEQAVSHMRLHQ